jgi:phenylacetate-coenzyme A ligase PaaK-like adenylate-forming protein
VQTLKVRAELRKGFPAEKREEFKEHLTGRIRDALEGVHADVELVEEGTLPKTQYKGQRVRDNRTTSIKKGGEK